MATNSRTRSASSSSSSPPAKRQKITVAPFAAAFPRRTLLSSSRWVNLPEDIWVHQILHPFLDLKGLATVGRCNTFFEEYWQYVLKQNVIRVPEGCPTMNQAMELAVVFSERNECTRENSIRVEVGEGKHVIVSGLFGLLLSCSNITIVGKGKGKTTILGGFNVKNQQHVTFEALSITNRRGHGMYCEGGETNVDVLECVVKECGSTGVFVSHGATVAATHCEFMDNGGNGVFCNGANTKARLNDCTMHHNGRNGLSVCNDAVVDLQGTKTDIHSNKEEGVLAYDNAKVNIHLPSQHNTSHDNVKGDRVTQFGGSIANINADGTFTHVPAPVEEDDY